MAFNQLNTIGCHIDNSLNVHFIDYVIVKSRTRVIRMISPELTGFNWLLYLGNNYVIDFL